METVLELLESAGLPAIAHELVGDARLRCVNRSFTRLFGYDLTDAPTVAAWAQRAYPDPEERTGAMERWWAGIANRQAGDGVAPCIDHRITDKSGRRRDVAISFAVHHDMAIVTFRDLTATRRAEAALAAERCHAEQTAFMLTENMPAGAYTMVLRPGAALAEFAFLSRQFLSMLELTREEAVGDPMTGFSRVHPDDRPGWLELNAEAFAARKRFSGETRVVANGETRWVRAESVPRALEDGSVIWEGILVDITPLKEAEARLKAVLDAARAYTWRRDLRSGVIEFDDRWTSLVGRTPGNGCVSSDQWMRMVHPDDIAEVLAALTAFETGAAAERILTYRQARPDGGWIWLQVHAGVSERDGDGNPAVLSGVTFDISAEVTARHRMQEEQAQLREDLQRAQQRDTVTQVAGRVAHDLNNLIAVVAGTTEMLEQKVDDQPWLREGLGRIGRAVSMAGDLIAGLGGLVRADTPRTSHDLGRLLRDAVELLGQRRIVRHAVRLDLPEGGSPIWANQTEMAQVIVNLAINACDSGTPEQPARVTLTALPSGSPPPQRKPDAGMTPPAGLPMALFTVHDTGSGMTAEVKARIFRSNFTTKGKAGTGLGLPIVSSILQANHAALWVDSTPGVGTTMTVAWPSIENSSRDNETGEHISTKEVEGSVPPANLLQDTQILVVDDLLDVAEVLADMLEAAGATAVAVPDPLEAVDALAEAPGVWSALVSDLHMEGMDGRALARYAQRLTPSVPTVLVTARPETLGEPYPAEFSSVLSKPVTASRLIDAVRKAARQTAISCREATRAE